ncbi:MAG: YhcH/YjgK/YiaL family protein [Synergistes sp.]|nr:YhcH/YjgK/YiaL family protein [Synergistes sp.]
MICGATKNFEELIKTFACDSADLTDFLAALPLHTFEELKEMSFGKLDVRFGEYETRPQEEIPFEAHRKFWDMQIVMEGEELIGDAPITELMQKTPYDEEKDIAFYEGTGQNVKLSAGTAALVGPLSGHRPGSAAENGRTKVKKIVIKIPVPEYGK